LKKIFVADIKERDVVDSLFLVRDKVMAMAKNGKPYMTLKLMDRSGEVEGRVWDRVDEFDRLFAKDDFIRVRAKASVYMGKMQLVVQNIERIDENSVDLGDFLPVSANDSGQMLAEVRQLVAAMGDEHYRALMEAFLADEEFVAAYSKAPAAKSMHHVYLGGLLEHSLSIARLVGDVCKRYPRLDADLLLCGALLHDIGKVAELSYARSFGYTDAGKLLGHIVIGVEMIAQKITALPAFPVHKALLIKHLILSHHGQYDYGSPKRPKTLEAVVLNFLDDMDSKINGVQAHIDKEVHGDSAWTSYHRLYDRYFFMGESTAAAAPAGEESPAAAPASAVASATGKETVSRAVQRGGGNHKKKLATNLGEQMAGLSLDLFDNQEEQ